MNNINLGKVAVLSGGISAEREISLMSGQAVLQALRDCGVDAERFDPAQQNLTELQTFKRAFITLHGRYGEDGTIQGVLEHLQIPYTGSNVLGSALAMDKITSKRIFQAHGLLTPRFQVLHAGFDAKTLVSDLGLPLIIKPNSEGSSLGVTKVSSIDEIAQAYTIATQFDAAFVLAEEFIDGPELTCALLENEDHELEALPAIQICAPNGNYSYHNKYFSQETLYLCPAGLSDEMEAKVRDLAIIAAKTLGCSGPARVDMIWSQHDQQLYCLEVNTSPGMRHHSLVPTAAAAAGLNYDALVLRILRDAKLKTLPQSGWKALHL